MNTTVAWTIYEYLKQMYMAAAHIPSFKELNDKFPHASREDLHDAVFYFHSVIRGCP